MTVSWAPPAAWGDVCVPPIKNLYTVYLDTSANPSTPLCTNTTLTSCIKNNITPGVTYYWKVLANNGELDGLPTGVYSCTVPSLAKDWYTSIDGNVYAPGISAKVPAGTPWNPKAIGYGFASLFNSGNTNTSVVNGTPVENPASGYWVDRMPIKAVGSFWTPYKSTFGTPSNTTPTANFQNLNPDNVYTFSGTIGANTAYTLTKDGVAVVYVTGVNPFTINGNFTSSSTSRRIVFVTNSNVSIGSNVFTTNPIKTSTPNIQAAIITSGSITLGAAIANPSIVLEGPFAARSSLNLTRSPYTTYTYPSEVVIYNPTIISRLTSQERSSSNANYTGLMTNEIIWEGDL
jgi:hypothetical protein